MHQNDFNVLNDKKLFFVPVGLGLPLNTLPCERSWRSDALLRQKTKNIKPKKRPSNPKIIPFDDILIFVSGKQNTTTLETQLNKNGSH